MLLPVIASASYEILKLSNRLRDNFIMKLIIKPGLWLQKMTAREPSNKQIEVAIRALDEIIK